MSLVSLDTQVARDLGLVSGSSKSRIGRRSNGHDDDSLLMNGGSCQYKSR